jgi:hypothetical protein
MPQLATSDQLPLSPDQEDTLVRCHERPRHRHRFGMIDEVHRPWFDAMKILLAAPGDTADRVVCDAAFLLQNQDIATLGRNPHRAAGSILKIMQPSCSTTMTFLMDLFESLYFGKSFRRAIEPGQPIRIPWIGSWGRGESIDRRMVFKQQRGSLLPEPQAFRAVC